MTRAYLDTLDRDMADLLDHAEFATMELDLAALSPPARALGQKVYYVLAMLLRGPALLLLRRCPRGHGFECWRSLRQRYEGSSSSRLHTILQRVLRPEPFPSDAMGFETALQDWELLTSKWEALASDLLNDAIRRQILLEQSPPQIRVQLTMQNHDSYLALRRALLGYLVNSRDWSRQDAARDAGPQPMDVGAITQWRPTGSKGKGKGKSKNKDKDGKETRDCYHCGKTGHLARDCWAKERGDPPQQQRRAEQSWTKGKGKGKTKHKGKQSHGVHAVLPENPGHDEQDGGGEAEDVGTVWEEDRGDWILGVLTEPLADQAFEKPFNQNLTDEAFEKQFKQNLTDEAFEKQSKQNGTDEAFEKPLKQNLAEKAFEKPFKQNLAEKALEKPFKQTMAEGTLPGTGGQTHFYIGAVPNHSRGEVEEIMVDSGAAKHVCPRGWHADEPTEQSGGEPLRLRTADGTNMKHYGQRAVCLEIEGVGGTARATFEVTDVCRPILSVQCLLRAGHELIFKPGFAVFRHQRGKEVELIMRRGLFYLPAVVTTSAGDAMRPMPLDVAPLEDVGPSAPQPLAEGAAEADLETAGPLPVGLGAPLRHAPRQPEAPTEEERRTHELTHLPAAAWCEDCVRGRGKAQAHEDQRGHTIDAILPVIQMDYFYAGDDETSTLGVAACDRASTSLFGSGATQKGPSCLYAVRALAAWIRELGHPRVCLQSDGEPAILSYAAAVRDRVVADGLAQQVSVQASPRGDHQANGGAERTVQTLRGIARVLLSQIKTKTGEHIGPSSQWWPWAVRHAAWSYNRFHIRKDTRCTAYAKVRHRNYGQAVLPFGEQVLARRPGAHLQKALSQYVLGVWLGRDGHTDEHIIGSRAGVFRTKAVRRLQPERAWEKEAIVEMRWTPWCTADASRGRPPKPGIGEPILSAPLPTKEEAYRTPPPTRKTPGEAASSSQAPGEAASSSQAPAASSSRAAEAGSSGPPEQREGIPDKRPRTGLQQALKREAPDVQPMTPRAQPAPEEPPPSPPKRPRTEDVIAEVCEEPTIDWKQLASTSSAWQARRHAARQEHLKLLQHHDVYEAKLLPPGVAAMSVRWVDKDDYTTAKARLTARGFEQERAEDEHNYSATPCPPTLRILLCLAYARNYAVMVGDCAQAFLQTPLDEEIWVTPPPEAAEPEGVAWLLHKTLPGLRCGPRAWSSRAEGVTEEKLKMTSSRIDPTVCSDPSRGLWLMRHMDDYLGVGPPELLKETADVMKETLLLRDITYLEHSGDSVQFLGAVLARRHDGFDVTINGQLTEDIIDDAGLAGQVRAPKLPGAKTAVLNETPLNPVDHKYYRMQVGRLLFLSQFRPDLQFVVGQLSRHVSAPTTSSAEDLKRCIRYLGGSKDWVLKLRPSRGLAITCFTDSDWAGQPDRRSISGGALLCGGAPVLTWSRTQASRALSSCEAELYGMGSGAVEALWLASFFSEQGLLRGPPVLYTDSASAQQLAGRRGQGRLKHVQVRLLALQDWQKEGRLQIARCTSQDNLADPLTKHYSKDVATRLFPLLGVGPLA